MARTFRKEIRQPDALQTYGRKALLWFVENQKVFYAGLAGVAQAATAYCLGRGYQRAVNVAATDPPLAGNTNWAYRQGVENPDPLGQGSYNYHAARVNTWSATCEKKVRVRRR